MQKFLEDVRAEVNELGEIRINGARFVTVKQKILDGIRERGEYGRYLKTVIEETRLEAKKIEQQTVRVSDELINQIFESSEMDM